MRWLSATVSSGLLWPRPVLPGLVVSWLVSLVLSCLGLPLHAAFSALLAFLAQTHRLSILVRENSFTSYFIPLQSLCRVWVLALVRGAKAAAAKTVRRM